MHRKFIAIIFASAVVLSPSSFEAQASGPTLTLEEAQRIARQNNPELQQSLNAMRGANAAVRTAYGQMLPSISTSLGSQYQQGGSQVVSGAELGASSDILSSSYSINMSYRLSTNTFITPKIQAANRDAIESDIDGATEQLRSFVIQQYLTALQAEARATLQDTLVKTAELQLAVANARASAGAATPLDVRRAEVALGQVQVAAIQAHNQVEIDKLRLFQRMGVLLPIDVQLTSTFSVSPVTFSLDDILDMAQKENPGLEALRSRDRVAALNTRRAKAEYAPSLSISTGIGGYTYQYRDPQFLIQRGRSQVQGARANCFTNDSLRVGAGLSSIAAQCQLIDFTPEQEARILSANKQYPFDFTRNPRSVTASISLPLFDGFAREQRVAEAEAARSNARHSIRTRELALTTDVTTAYLTLNASARSVALQEQNSEKARQELDFVLERYRVGAATFVEVSDSRSQYERAENDRINAVYDYHKAFASLESAVGRPLR